MEYTIGDTANGHTLTEWGWVPTEQVALSEHIEAEVDRRMANSRTYAWLLWFFLGGFNAHLAYIHPKNRTMILALSIVAFIVTFGLSGLLWLFSWAFLLDGKAFDALRAEKRNEVEREIVTRKSLYA